MSTDNPPPNWEPPSEPLGDAIGHPFGPENDLAFAEAVTRYLDRGLTAEELAQFNAKLLADADARELFVRYVRVHGMLSERALSVEPALVEPALLDDGNQACAVGHDPSGESLDDAQIQPALRDDEPEAVAFEGEVAAPTPWDPARQDAASNRIPPDPDRRLPIRSGIAALLVLGLSIGIWVWHRSANGNKIASSAVVQPVTPPPVVEPPVVEAPVILGSAINAKFELSSTSLGNSTTIAVTPGQPMPDAPLFLQTGWIRIDFPSGVSAVVEAPAHFSIQSKTTMTLTSGRLSAEVPQAGHGFTVRAPFCQVVDLGTAFGIAVDGDGRHMVEVFKGLVSLNRPPAAGKEAGIEVLSQGAVRQIETITEPAVSTPPDPAAFVRREQFDSWRKTLDQGENASLTDRWRAYSEQLSRDPTLALYYTFTERDGSPAELKNHASATAGQYDLPLSAPAPSWVDGRLPGISALDFDPAKNQRLLLPAYPLTTNGQLSGTAWVFARSLTSWGSIAKSWGNTRTGAFHLGLLADSGLLEIQLDGTRPGGPRISESQRFPVGRWVHIAFTSDGKTLRLYRDGKEVAATPSRPIDIDQPIKSISFGVKTDDDGLTPSIPPQCGYWDGKIGEFALFHRALSADEIARMSQFGPP